MESNNKLIYGKGYIGEKIGDTFYGATTKFYSIWFSMLRRCYDEKTQLKNPTYIGCYVDESWLNLQIFCKWCEENYIDGFCLDKDILIKGNKIYGPNTCCFVPTQINSLFVKKSIKNSNLPIGISHYKKSKKPAYQVSIRYFNSRKFCGVHYSIEKAFESYKIAKENYIREVADFWKDKISNKTYEALINYKIEITD
jgi:hypothetical protein